MVSKAYNDKMVWLDEFNKGIMEDNITKDKADLNALIDPDKEFKENGAMDLPDNTQEQTQINNKQQGRRTRPGEVYYQPNGTKPSSYLSESNYPDVHIVYCRGYINPTFPTLCCQLY